MGSVYLELLWTAPEHLRCQHGIPSCSCDCTFDCDNGSQKGDIYSFAIIMQEIIMKQPPFDITPAEAPGCKAI